MDAYQAIVSKRDTRRFSPEPVDDQVVRHILQAARMAGSAKNEQQNRMVVLTDRTDKERLAEAGKFADWVPDAPVMVAFVVPTGKGRMFDVGRMAQNIMVAANSFGLASCPVTFHDADVARKALGLPDDLEAPMGVGFGCPGPADPGRERSPRLPLDEYVRWGRWDG